MGPHEFMKRETGMKFLFRTIVAASVLFLLTSMTHPGWREAVSALLVASMLSWVAARSQTRGVPLFLAITGLYYIPQILINIPEGVLFDVVEIGQAPVLMAHGLVVAFVIAGVVAMLFGSSDGNVNDDCEISTRSLTVPGFVWRLAASVVVFIVCYGVAGSLIFPFVEGYYDMRVMPEPLAIASMQVLRACALCATALLVLRLIPRSKDARLLLAVLFPVLGCIALMIPDNELMPPMVRLVHTLEVVPYYTLYGFLLAVWFGPKRQVAAPAHA